MNVHPVAHVLGADPTSAVIDGPLVAFIVVCLNQYLALESKARREPGLTWTAPFAETIRHLRIIAAHHRESANGRREAAVSREMSAALGPPADIDHPESTMVTVKELANARGITERHARRIAARVGTKVGGAWLVPQQVAAG